jgi:hypothetical protein
MYSLFTVDSTAFRVGFKGEATGAVSPGPPQNRYNSDFIETFASLKS